MHERQSDKNIFFLQHLKSSYDVQTLGIRIQQDQIFMAFGKA